MSAFGLDVEPLPDGETPLEAVVVVKTLDSAGEVSLWIRESSGLNAWERLGMLTIAAHQTNVSLMGGFEADDDE